MLERYNLSPVLCAPRVPLNDIMSVAMVAVVEKQLTAAKISLHYCVLWCRRGKKVEKLKVKPKGPQSTSTMRLLTLMQHLLVHLVELFGTFLSPRNLVFGFSKG